MKLAYLKSGTHVYDNHTVMRSAGVITVDGYYAITRTSRTDWPNGDYIVWGKLKSTGMWVRIKGRRTVRGIDITRS